MINKEQHQQQQQQKPKKIIKIEPEKMPHQYSHSMLKNFFFFVGWFGFLAKRRTRIVNNTMH